MKKANRKVYIQAAFVLCFIAAVASFRVTNSYAFVTGNVTGLTGWAWSDNIGWINLNGVSVSTSTGDMSGYAWSDNVGWISFNASDTLSCPQAPCTANLSMDTLSGFAKVLSGGSAQSGGWDGFISLNGVTRISDTDFSGYAWGSDVVGWVDMSLVKTATTSCPLGQVFRRNACRTPSATLYFVQ